MTTATIRAIVLIIIATIVAIVALNVLRPGDNTALTVQIVSIVAPTSAALLALLNSSKNTEKINETHLQVAETKDQIAETHAQVVNTTEKIDTLNTQINGRLSQLMDQSVAAARLLGLREGEQAERERHDEGHGA
jgi:uncharacterized protein involved in exopolysaccharide biosynthesis